MGLIPETLSRSVERYGLGYIRPRHNEIARRLVCGQSQSEIARIMGINIGRLSIIVNSPLFKIVVARLSKLRDDSMMDIQEELKEFAPTALAEIQKVVLTSPSEKLRLEASKDWLDRAGVIRKGQAINFGVQVNINPVDLEKYKPGQQQLDGRGVASLNNLASSNVSVSSDLSNNNVSYVHDMNITNEQNMLDEDLRLLDEVMNLDNADKEIEPPTEDLTNILKELSNG